MKSNDFSELRKLYFLWDEFLVLWPLSRLKTMNLDEYSFAGSKDTFTYWIESRLDGLGSIWGGSAFKFGVFSRKSTEDKESGIKLSYSETHGWYSSLGTSAEEAFEKIRVFVVKVAEWAAEGDLEAIESFEHLGETFKWKIAFHYQNRESPRIVAVFKRAPLAVFTNSTTSQNMATLQKETLTKQPHGIGILEFGRQVWEAWSLKNLPIWKLSHGLDDFSPDERKKYLQVQLAVMHKNTSKKQGKNYIEVPLGDLFYLCHGNENLPLIGQFTSAAEPCDKGDGWLQRSYRILKHSTKQGGYQGAQKGWTPNYRSTFKKVSPNDLPQFEKTLLKPFFDTDLAELAALSGELSSIQAPVSETSFMTKVDTPVSMQPACFNRIYYGPPGTGKTYRLMELLQSDYQSKVASISSEEWRDQFIAEKIATLTWWEGAAAALYDFGGSANVPQLAEHPFIKAIAIAKSRTSGVKQTLWGTMQRHTIKSSTTVNTEERVNPSIFDKTSDSEWKLTGEWQEACADLITLIDEFNADQEEATLVQRFSFVTFHQSYGYEEFVEGLRPVLNNDNESSEVAYEIRPGVFKELCRKARQSPNQRFAMVIDEINRGNISKIFGELITLIEPDKRDPLNGSKPPLELTLAYSGEKFSIPANIDIIGTMNTADRSLALLDTALRRRFDFVPLLPDTRAEKDPENQKSAPLSGLIIKTAKGAIDVRMMLERINDRIEALYGRDHCIGHAYFTSLIIPDDDELRFQSLANIFHNRIVPLLEEYFFEDWHKIRLVLGDNQKPDAAQFITESTTHAQDLNHLFGNNHSLDSFNTKRRYQPQSSAFQDPNSYIGIYQKLV